MKIETPFITPVFHATNVEHLGFARQLFADEKPRFTNTASGLATTLKNYELSNADPSILKRCENGKLFGKFVEDFAIWFAQEQGVRASEYTAFIKNAWLNEMVSGSAHHRHSHYGNHLSGCYYVDVPENSPGLTLVAPSTRFDKPNWEIASFTPLIAETWRFDPKEGDLFLWPSYLPHEVAPRAFDGVRRSIAFDIVFTPKEPE
jgi:uncharacterized protein (TIGR02466 family)